MKITVRILTLAVIAALSSPLIAADKVNPVEQKMRETIRSTMIQLRDANAKLATAQSAQAEAEDKIKELQTKLEELTKKTDSERKTANETIDDLKTKLATQDLQVSHLSESLGKWKYGYAKMAEYAKQTEAKRADLASKIILLDRRIADQQVKNAEMYRIGNEVLDRYAQFGLGTAISAREPFVGITKVKFQNLVQDYQTKMTQQTIRHDDPEPPASKP
jgi:DNA repair exonuclease SbcCD ATPase subunit